MRKALVVARREFLATVRTKVFIISIILMPVLMAGGLIAEVLFREFKDVSDRKLAVIDLSPPEVGSLFDALSQAAGARNESEIFADPFDLGLSAEGKQRQPRYVLERVPLADTAGLPELRLQLSEQVREKTLRAYLEIGPGALDGTGDGQAQRVHYFSDNVTDDAMRQWVMGQLNHAVRSWRVARTGLPADTLAWAISPVGLQLRGLSTRSESGAISETATEENVAKMVSSLVLMGLIFFCMMFATMPLVHSTIEEKMQRIAEVMLGSVPPFQLMLGKLLGAAGVTLVMVCLYLGGALVVAVQLGYADMIDGAQLAWFFVFLFLSVTMFGSLLLALGSACTDMKEAQSAVMPVSLLMSLPLFVIGPVMVAADGGLAVFLSFLPPTAPTIMMLRLGLDSSMPAWHPWVAVMGCLLTAWLAVYAAGRIFRVGMLMQGKRASFSQMLRWVLRA